MLKSAAMDVLASRGWLAHTPEPFRSAVLKHCDLITLAAGQTFYMAGDEGGGIYGVAAGRLEVHLPSPENAPTLAHISGVGVWFGDIAAIAGGNRRVSIVAGPDTRLMRLPRAEMQRITESDPAAWQHFARLVAMNMTKAISVANALRCQQPVFRIACTLLNLVDEADGDAVELPLSQSELGSLAGLSRSTVILALEELEARGLLRRHYGRLALPSIRALHAFVGAADES